ncbi:cytochrome c oxidase assembly protein subunit 15 [Fodinibius salinus]|uniref:Cytochrome c oxidase assembly protein subunit 15 n=1 Tax=Fodinibius salinus TaxID=860790 RepID=A0A5D3YKS7_9BACT|nr:COX15/CtaA family protein [Fodinibius salinus]TYP94796.1 cytochrome c oxidase assembly protein subunit 15 [Fodinibius salinus]
MNSQQKKYIRRWFWSGAILIFLMVVVGGITRLTDSGLSMSDWNLIMGTFPPMNEAEWMAVFGRYKEFPQYQQLNMGMSLAEFKEIFFWEYLHRLLGRMIGFVFLIPFAFFWIRGYFNAKTLRRAWILFGLGALQGAMGWIMVKSGLVNVPYVSHYRLAAHLILAMLLFSFCIWYALDLYENDPTKKSLNVQSLRRWSVGLIVLFIFQVIWGAFTAGLDAGYIYNTFPMMNGEWIPQNGWNLQPLIANFVENPGTVQWTHRILGTLLGLVALGLWWKSDNSDVSNLTKQKARILLGMILTQYVLGILTIITNAEILIAVVHQAGAFLVLFFWIWYYHDLKSNWASV